MIRLVLFLCMVSTSALAADYCDMDTALASYKSAVQRKKIGDEEGAHKIFKDLAEASIAPAQRHLAQYYLEESREDMALEKAIMWSQLAAWGGDEDAQLIAKQAVEASRHQVSEIGLTWARDWRPVKPDCVVADLSKKNDDDFKTVSRYPVIRAENLDEDVFASFSIQLNEALRIVDQVAPYFSPLVELIPAFEIIPGEGADRFIQWDEDNDWVQISAAYLKDQSARQLSYSLVLTVQRRLFEKMKDAQFVDQISGNYGPVKFYGSLYGDVKTKKFLKLFHDAFKMARKLPVVLRDKVNSIDEIYYMPPSRYHFSRLPSKDVFASYDYKRSRPEKRMITVSHKIAFEDAAQIKLPINHPFPKPRNNTIIEGYKGQVDGKDREEAILKALEGELSAVQSLFSKKTSKHKEMIDAWDESGPDGINKLYCAATYDQMKAAIFLNIPANKVSRTVKMKGCKKARAAWQAHRNKK